VRDRTDNKSTGAQAADTMCWPLIRPGKNDASAVLQDSEGRLMATSENVGLVSDTRLASATEKIDQVSRLHRQGTGVRLNSPGAVRRHHRAADTYAMAWEWRFVDRDRVMHELITSQRAKWIDQCRLKVARSTLYATGRWRSLRQGPTRRPALCRRRVHATGEYRWGSPRISASTTSTCATFRRAWAA
jgi:hypothetical protein